MPDSRPLPPSTDERLDAPPCDEHPDGAFLVTSAGTRTLSAKQTRASRFDTPSRGVRIDVQAPDQALARTAAASLVCSDGTVVTDLSAARLWDIPIPPWIEFDESRPVSVAALPDRARPQRRDVHGRRLRLPDDHLTTCRSLTVTTPARTWLDCAQYLPVEHLIVWETPCCGVGWPRMPICERCSGGVAGGAAWPSPAWPFHTSTPARSHPASPWPELTSCWLACPAPSATSTSS